MRLRQEVVNVLLAQALADQGLAAVPEQVIRAAEEGRTHLPDVIVDFRGLRLAIEGEFAHVQDAEHRAIEKALQRVERGIAHIGVAAIYPSELADILFEEGRTRLAAAQIRFAVLTELPDVPSLTDGGLDDLAEGLHHAYEQLSKDEALHRALQLLQGGVERFVSSLREKGGITGRLAEALGIVDPDPLPGEGEDE